MSAELRVYRARPVKPDIEPMSELNVYRALQVAERNLNIGYSPRCAVAKATEALSVEQSEIALLLLEKTIACSAAREERQARQQFDAMRRRAA